MRLRSLLRAVYARLRRLMAADIILMFYYALDC